MVGLESRVADSFLQAGHGKISGTVCVKEREREEDLADSCMCVSKALLEMMEVPCSFSDGFPLASLISVPFTLAGGPFSGCGFVLWPCCGLLLSRPVHSLAESTRCGCVRDSSAQV